MADCQNLQENYQHIDNYALFLRKDIKRIKEVNLTPMGKFRLTAYPVKAIYLARHYLKASPELKNKSNKIKWYAFKSVCEEYCKRNNINPFYRLSFIFMDRYGYKKSDLRYVS